MNIPTTNPLRVGLRQEKVITPQCLVIFGASGDLTHRKLIPALFQLFKQRRLPSEFAVLGCARRPWTNNEFRQRMKKALGEAAKDDPTSTDQFLGSLFYESVDSFSFLFLFFLNSYVNCLILDIKSQNNFLIYFKLI